MKKNESIIEKVVSERKIQREKEEQERIQQEQKNQEILSKTSDYLNDVYIKMKQYPPDFSPIGKWLKKSNWNVSIGEIDVKGVSSSIFTKKLITIECILSDISTIEQLKQVIQKRVNDTTQSNQYISTCFILPKIKDTELIKIIQDFNHYNFSPSLYDLFNQEIYYNIKDWKTSFFIRWFKKDETPKSIIGFLEEISDDNNIFTKSQITELLHMDEKEINKMFDWLIESNKIIHLKIDEFTLMK